MDGKNPPLRPPNLAPPQPYSIPNHLFNQPNAARGSIFGSPPAHPSPYKPPVSIQHPFAQNMSGIQTNRLASSSDYQSIADYFSTLANLSRNQSTVAQMPIQRLMGNSLPRIPQPISTCSDDSVNSSSNNSSQRSPSNEQPAQVRSQHFQTMLPTPIQKPVHMNLVPKPPEVNKSVKIVASRTSAFGVPTPNPKAQKRAHPSSGSSAGSSDSRQTTKPKRKKHKRDSKRKLSSGDSSGSSGASTVSSKPAPAPRYTGSKGGADTCHCIIHCGIQPKGQPRRQECFNAALSRMLPVFTCEHDRTQTLLYKASHLAKHCGVSAPRISMFLQRRLQHMSCTHGHSQIHQAIDFKHKAKGVFVKKYEYFICEDLFESYLLHMNKIKRKRARAEEKRRKKEEKKAKKANDVAESAEQGKPASTPTSNKSEQQSNSQQGSQHSSQNSKSQSMPSLGTTPNSTQSSRTPLSGSSSTPSSAPPSSNSANTSSIPSSSNTGFGSALNSAPKLMDVTTTPKSNSPGSGSSPGS